MLKIKKGNLVAGGYRTCVLNNKEMIQYIALTDNGDFDMHARNCSILYGHYISEKI